MARGKMKTPEQIRAEAEKKIIRANVRQSVSRFTQDPSDEVAFNNALEALKQLKESVENQPYTG